MHLRFELPGDPRQPAAANPDAYAAIAWIEAFCELAHMAIGEEHDEALRRSYEDELLRRAVYLRAAGLFDVMQIRHPALRAMVDDAR